MSNTIYTPYQGTNYDNIPETLKNTNFFVLYRLEPKVNEDGAVIVKANGTPKMDKIPYQPSGRKADTTNPDHLIDWDTALAAYRTGAFSGIGVILTAANTDHPLCCIDLDDSRNRITGQLTDRAQSLVNRVNGWTEISASGDGVHIFALCSETFERTRTDGIEVYQSARFIALTGNVVEGSATEIEDRTAIIKAIYNEYFPQPDRPSPLLHVAKSDEAIDIDERLKIAMKSKSGASIKRLLDGDTGEYESGSEADMALCVHLAFWLNHDAMLIERAFSRSALAQRDKWRMRKDYRDRTIRQAINTQQETYSRSQEASTMSTPTAVKREPTTVDSILQMLDAQKPESLETVNICLLTPDAPLPANHLIQVTAKPGAGKSTLVLKWAKDAAETGIPVFYLDRDNGLATPQERIRQRFGGALPENFRYWGQWNRDMNGAYQEPPRLTEQDSSVYFQLAQREPGALFIFDTQAAFTPRGADENDNNAMSEMYGILRQLVNTGSTVLIIHHGTKSGTSPSRGASAIVGAIDVGLEIVATHDYDGRIVRQEVTPFKDRTGTVRKVLYDFVNGVPVRAAANAESPLLDLLARNHDITKEKFTKIAMENGFKRATIRDFLEKYIVGGIITHQNQKLTIKKPPMSSNGFPVDLFDHPYSPIQ